MEPISNAGTVRNNNSSRFGKHFDIQFDRGGKIVGAGTSVYLLEKPRITNHMKGERNYRIFYVLQAPEVVRKHGLVPGEDSEGLWEQFKVLNQAGTVQGSPRGTTSKSLARCTRHSTTWSSAPTSAACMR